MRALRPGSLGFSARLTLAGVALTVLLVGGMSGFLIASSATQTDSIATTNSVNRSAVLDQLLTNSIAPQMVFDTGDLATRVSASFSASSHSNVNATLKTQIESGGTPPVGATQAVLDRNGMQLYPMPAASSANVSRLTSVQQAMRNSGGHDCPIAVNTSGPQSRRIGVGFCGVDELDGVPVYAAATQIDIPNSNSLSLPHASASSCSGPNELVCAGILVEYEPLAQAFGAASAEIGYPTGFVSAANTTLAERYSEMQKGNTLAIRTAFDRLPPSVNSSLHTLGQSNGQSGVASYKYTAGSLGGVMASFRPVNSPVKGKIAGFLMVAVPLAPFASQTQRDELSLLAIGVTAMLLVAACVMAFVNRYVYRPVTTLETGVSRIAKGDYSSPLPIHSGDELGRLAESVNAMQHKISDYVGRLDNSVSQLHAVSRALTTTTDGTAPLQAAVLGAAKKLAGATDSLAIVASAELASQVDQAAPLTPEDEQQLQAGNSVRKQSKDAHLLLVPMIYQHELRSVLIIKAGKPLTELDERALVALANNAAVAFENSRLFEQERATVETLRQLDSMKSDFLSSARHELRTPILAILGQIELFDVAWPRLEEAEKRDMVHDIEISTKRLGDLLETIMDVSLLSGEQAVVQMCPVTLRPIINQAVDDVKNRYASDVLTKVTVKCSDEIAIEAESKRLYQVLFAVLDNAVKFSAPRGEVAVTAVRDQDSTIAVVVEDNGVGISHDALPHVFDRFYQEDGSKTRSFGGLGMGLALVMLLCDLQGAAVGIESEKGRGTKVTFRWPVATHPVANPSPNSQFHLAI